MPSEDDDGIRVFVEDRGDVVRRAVPRLAVGTLATFSVIGLIAWVAEGTAELHVVVIVVLVLTVVALLLRFDVWALQFGRRVRYEISSAGFRVFVGDRERLAFRFEDVSEWYDADSASTWAYRLGFGYWRTFAFPTPLPTYSFRMKAPPSAPLAKEVRPPALFRWADRGGLDDVSAALGERLGRPLNRI